MKKVQLIISFLFLFTTLTLAQVTYRVSDESTMTITGTSTIHDWTSTVNEIKGTYVFTEDILSKKLPKSGSIVDNLIMEIPVLSIESPRGATMDNKTYNALKSEEYPNIVFDLKTDNIINSTGEKLELKVNGDLSMAGSSKNINLILQGERLNRNTLKFKGSYPIDMMTYDISPPSAMFGQIKTGKDVTIDFELTLIKE